MEEKLKQRSSGLIKIVLYGPESTGKTTLARQLAAHYQTLWVPEYARNYLQEKWDREQKICEPHDLIPIAEGQMEEENRLSELAAELLFCDTDLLVTKVYSEVYYSGFVPPLLEKYAIENKYDLYLLTQPDTPWVADDLRDKPHERDLMYRKFEEVLEFYRRPFARISGLGPARLQSAISIIDQLIQHTRNVQSKG